MRNNPAVTGLTHLEVGCNDERNETAFAEDEPSGKRKRFKELNELVAHPKPLVGDNPPEITLDDMEERAWLKRHLGY